MAVGASAAESRRLLADVTTSDGLLALEEDGVPVGKFAASTLMRAHRISSVDPADPRNARGARRCFNIVTSSRPARAPIDCPDPARPRVFL